MSKEKKTIDVKGIGVSVKKVGNNDYLSLTDMLKAKEGEFFVKSWFRNRNTIEFLGIWEQVHNPNFNWYEFDLIRKEAGLNNFGMSVEKWVEKTNAIGFVASTGRYGGTFAHSDIAMEFGMWISPEFKVYLVKEFQRLKADEQKQLAWSARRELTKINYRIQTDAIKEQLIVPTLTQRQIGYVYANEADMLNVALFGKTAGDWSAENPSLAGNMRDYATLPQLLVLANLESNNAEMILNNVPQSERLVRLNNTAKRQLQILQEVHNPLLLEKKDENE